MAQKSEIIASQSERQDFSRAERQRFHTQSFLEIFVVFLLIVTAVWTPQGSLNAFFSISAAACVLGFALAGTITRTWNSREMGLTRPLAGTRNTLLIGVVLCVVIWLAGVTLRFSGSSYPIPWNRSWQYAIWALVQQFILQSIFFLRFERALGSRPAVVFSATLYALAHVPNPVLAPLTFIGGLIFCELFRRYRNLFPLGIIHAALGLTIAASFPNSWLHHMRVGIGYLTH
ncbi:MAG TPA: type II CAAX endopeptidase family protein [Terriglobales bacterium]|nr:type II CAAX endopeptidase family protein [Terriglobales bacterium]